MILRPCAMRRREGAIPKRKARIDARITNEAEFEGMLESVDGMGETELKERLRAVTGIIWEERQRIAMGRRIRRVEDLESNIHEKNESMKLEIARKQGEIGSYAKEFMSREW